MIATTTVPHTLSGQSPNALPKTPTGIKGLDEITLGGLPKGRPTLVYGGAGCGKTLLAIEFLVRGAVEFEEPGLFVSFEETAEELAQNVASLGFDLKGLEAEKMIIVDYIQVQRNDLEETGEYDLEGLFIRLGYQLDAIGAKRIVLDSLETLFASFSNSFILRSELTRLFRWIKERGLTAIITGERGQHESETRHGLEEYISDCVIYLDNRVVEQITTHRLRVMKYRGSVHGTNEYPYLIDEDGISVLPSTSNELNHKALSERISSGVAELDEMLGGQGYFRGSTVLISGPSGSGKSSTAAHFADSVCRRGERCLYFAMEESVDQILRNMGSVGINLRQWVDKGLLSFQASRPSVYGLEMHLITMHKLVNTFKPAAVVVDPITNLIVMGNAAEVRSMLTRMIDFLKFREITSVFTSLSNSGDSATSPESNEDSITSLIDTWLLLRDIEMGGERNHGLYILKSRGMAHSNQIREFLLTDEGVKLVQAYRGHDGVLTGSARVAQEARAEETELARRQELERKRLEAHRHHASTESQLVALQLELTAQETQIKQLADEEEMRARQSIRDYAELARSRMQAPTMLSVVGSTTGETN
jgi:circadian clock protein KaiC